MKEIDTFIELHGRENVLAVLVDGEPVDSFPHQLCVDENGNPVEPLAADVRGGRSYTQGYVEYHFVRKLFAKREISNFRLFVSC